MPSKTRSRLQRKQRARQIIEGEDLSKQPHSIVVSRGKTGKNLNHLMLDFRRMMSPYTASNLKARKTNVLKDFLTIAGPLNVKHLVTFSKTKETVSFRIISTPKGPTMSFSIEKYVLRKDIESSIKRPVRDDKLYKNSPLLIMSEFPNKSDVDKFLYEAFRSLFPRIKPSQVVVDSIRRVVLLHYDKESDQVQLRHYAIRTRSAAGRKVRKLLDGNRDLPNMGKYETIEQFMEGMSGSESELEGTSAEVNNPKTGRTMNIRLTEIGPRMSIRLVKIEEGLGGGSVLYHKYKNKTEEEKLALDEKKQKQMEDKEERKRIQNENVAKKEKAKTDEKKKQEKLKKKEEEAKKGRQEHIEKLKDGTTDRNEKGHGRKRGKAPNIKNSNKKARLSKKDKSNLL